jgi:mannose-6-phosphate isomerase
MSLYPLKFIPLSKYRIWGGEKLNTVLNKGFEESNIGESWEISAVKNDETLVKEGDLKGASLTELISEYKGALVGEHVYEAFGNEFPLLIKFIDAKTPLSIQVHPHDAVAKERHKSFGKNEMWYVMEAEKSAELVVGFQKEVDKESYTKILEDGKVMEVLNSETVAEGDAFYIPTGRVHAIGAGVLLAEIQQTSDITYRIYDFDRVDNKTGQKRELHNDLAIDVIDFEMHDNYKTTYSKEKNQVNQLVNSPYFKTNFLLVNGELVRDFSKLDSFVIYICTKGSATIETANINYQITTGETILLPANINKIVLNTDYNATLLEVFY